MLDTAKHKIVSFWLTHGFLRRIAKRYPDYFESWINDLTDSKISKKIMHKRYIENIKFEAIAIDLNVDVRFVFRKHKEVIEKIINN